MSLLSSLPLAETGEWSTWVAVLGGLAGFASLLITLARGRGPAPVAPAPVAAPASVAPAPVAAPVAAATAAPVIPAPAAQAAIPDEIMALIAAAVAVTVGPNARVASVVPTPLDLQQQWSIEGRRQIYSSHQIR